MPRPNGQIPNSSNCHLHCLHFPACVLSYDLVGLSHSRIIKPLAGGLISRLTDREASDGEYSLRLGFRSFCSRPCQATDSVFVDAAMQIFVFHKQGGDSGARANSQYIRDTFSLEGIAPSFDPTR